MAKKEIGAYRAIIAENTEEIEGYNYIDVDYVTDMLDEIESKLGGADSLVDAADSVDLALDGVIGILTAISQYAAKGKVSEKLGNLIVEITKNSISMKDNLGEILQAIESVAEALSDLSDDLF